MNYVKTAVVSPKNVSAIDKILHVFYKNQELYQSDGVVLSNMVDKNNDNKIAVKFQEEVFETEIYSIEW